MKGWIIGVGVLFCLYFLAGLIIESVPVLGWIVGLPYSTLALFIGIILIIIGAVVK